MSFTVLYIEDEQPDREGVVAALNESNKNSGSAAINCRTVATLSALPAELTADVDVVLADLWYPPDENRAPNGFGLPWIIQQVEQFAIKEALGRPIPIIAYTSRSLANCLGFRDSLYDVWDKGSANHNYVAWKFTRIAREFTRYRPDAVLQRSIRSTPKTSPWREDVIRMTYEYDSGWSEMEQVDKAGEVILDIVYKRFGLDAWTKLKPTWDVIKRWERIDRVREKPARGHARHVINVYWLGYYILNHPEIYKLFGAAWEAQYEAKSECNIDKTMEALNQAWLFSALFHDMAQCFEHLNDTCTNLGKLFKKLDCEVDLGAGANAWERLHPKDRGSALLRGFDMDRGVVTELAELWERSLADSKPDHGVLAAVYLREALQEAVKDQKALNSALRAMAMHNIVGKVSEKSKLHLDWQREPISALLVICDQVQAWDREIHEPAQEGENWPDKSELLYLGIGPPDPHLVVRMDINYISPPHLEHAPLQRKAMRSHLVDVLRDKPNRALSRVSGLPFELKLDFFLDRRKLEASFPPA